MKGLQDIAMTSIKHLDDTEYFNFGLNNGWVGTLQHDEGEQDFQSYKLDQVEHKIRKIKLYFDGYLQGMILYDSAGKKMKTLGQTDLENSKTKSV